MGCHCLLHPLSTPLELTQWRIILSAEWSLSSCSVNSSKVIFGLSEADQSSGVILDFGKNSKFLRRISLYQWSLLPSSTPPPTPPHCWTVSAGMDPMCFFQRTLASITLGNLHMVLLLPGNLCFPLHLFE